MLDIKIIDSLVQTKLLICENLEKYCFITAHTTAYWTSLIQTIQYK